MLHCARRQAVLFIALCLTLLALFYANSPYIKRYFTATLVVTPRKDSVSELNERSHTTIERKTANRASSPNTVQQSVLKCKHGPKKSFLFLKTHKTGSTTLQNLFLRYAWVNGLFVGLPLHNNNFGFGETFSKKLMQPANKTVNMLIHHMTFDHEQVASVLPSDSVYFTILRDPATQFESSYKYFETIVQPFIRAKAHGGFKEFVSHPRRYFYGRKEGTFSWFAKNGMAHDLGFDYQDETEGYQRGLIYKMDKIFDLVMLSEHLDVSLLLLKDLMCWNIEDVVYLSVNARNVLTVERLSKDIAKKIYDWNKLDTALYKHYNETFWHRVKMYGESRMENDLKRLKDLKDKIANFCVEDKLLSNKDVKEYGLKMYNPDGMDMTQYQLKAEAKNNETCRQLILPEIQWWKKMSERQREAAPMRRTSRPAVVQ